MNITTQLGNLSVIDGCISIEDAFLYAGNREDEPAIRIDSVSDERSVIRISIYAVNRSLDDRYARFCKRLSVAIEKHRKEIEQ